MEQNNDAIRDAQTGSDALGDAERKNRTTDSGGVKRLLKMLSDGECKGISKGTVYKLVEFAREKGLL